MRMAGFYIKKYSPIRLFGEQIEYIVGRERPPPRRKVALSAAKRRMRSHILKHDASSTANAVPLPQPGKALKRE